jgi:hypothetical protein
MEEDAVYWVLQLSFCTTKIFLPSLKMYTTQVPSQPSKLELPSADKYHVPTLHSVCWIKLRYGLQFCGNSNLNGVPKTRKEFVRIIHIYDY